MSDRRWLDEARDPGRRALREALDEAERFKHAEMLQRRVWSRVSDPARAGAGARAGRRLLMAGALVASAAGAAALVATLRMPRPTAPERAALARAVPARPVTPRPPVVIATRAGERKVRLLAHGARAELAPQTVMAFDEQERPALERGEVRVEVPALPHAEPFVMRVASYRVVLAAARFTARAQPGGVSVTVEEGAAEVWDGARRVPVGPGQTWTDAPRPAAAPARPAASRPSAARPASGRDRAPGLAPAGTDEGPADLAAARAARAASDPRRALALYQRLAERGGPSAENALYEIGGIYHDQLASPREALAAWERYRARYPRGLLRAEADLSIVDTLAGLGESTRALNEALSFLKRYPHSERRGEVARVAGDLYRTRGNCRAAVGFYQTALDARLAGDEGDDAAWSRASCLIALGDAGAPAAVREYLARHPHGRHVADAARALGETARSSP
jgi:TolA-binding protein